MLVSLRVGCAHDTARPVVAVAVVGETGRCVSSGADANCSGCVCCVWCQPRTCVVSMILASSWPAQQQDSGIAGCSSRLSRPHDGAQSCAAAAPVALGHTCCEPTLLLLALHVCVCVTRGRELEAVEEHAAVRVLLLDACLMRIMQLVVDRWVDGGLPPF